MENLAAAARAFRRWPIVAARSHASVTKLLLAVAISACGGRAAPLRLELDRASLRRIVAPLPQGDLRSTPRPVTQPRRANDKSRDACEAVPWLALLGSTVVAQFAGAHWTDPSSPPTTGRWQIRDGQVTLSIDLIVESDLWISMRPATPH